MQARDEGNNGLVTTLTTPTHERRAPGTTATGLGGRQRRADDRRRVLVSATLATIRGGAVKRPGQRPLERARAVLGRMRAT
jgi:hypothetical protein